MVVQGRRTAYTGGRQPGPTLRKGAIHENPQSHRGDSAGSRQHQRVRQQLPETHEGNRRGARQGSQAERRADVAGNRDREPSRHAADDPSAVLQHAEPVDRGRPAGRARAEWRGEHRVQSARARHAVEQIFGRHSAGLPRSETDRFPEGKLRHAGSRREASQAERYRGRPRPVAGTAGARMGAARRTRYVRAFLCLAANRAPA